MDITTEKKWIFNELYFQYFDSLKPFLKIKKVCLCSFLTQKKKNSKGLN